MDIQNLATQVLMFEALNGRLPTTADGLGALVEKPVEADLPKWRKLLPEVPTDPWGWPYQYRAPGVKSAAAFEIYSLGPDGVVSGDDVGL